MALVRACSARFPALGFRFLHEFPTLSLLSLPRFSFRNLNVSASLPAEPVEVAAPKHDRRWRPLCLYHTQGKCTKVDDIMHLEKFNHDYSMGLQVSATEENHLRPQSFDYLLVLDLEGKVEILEFPVLMIDAKTMNFVDSFHRFVRPTQMSEQRIREYIEGKYGKLGVDRVWHDTATPFKDVLREFEIWMTNHQLWTKDLGGPLQRAAFVTCGNWDLKTKVPQQCKVSRIQTPSYFMEWINLKDVYLNFYNRRATGMMTMMMELNIPLVGSHHLGIDDAKNIARVLQRLLADGAAVQITARRSSAAPGEIYSLALRKTDSIDFQLRQAVLGSTLNSPGQTDSDFLLLFKHEGTRQLDEDGLGYRKHGASPCSTCLTFINYCLLSLNFSNNFIFSSGSAICSILLACVVILGYLKILLLLRLSHVLCACITVCSMFMHTCYLLPLLSLPPDGGIVMPLSFSVACLMMAQNVQHHVGGLI